MSTVAERLLEIIGSRSKSEFARQCGIPESSVRQWVDGTSLPSAEKLIAIAQATGVSIDWLLLGKGSKNSIDKGAENGESILVPRFKIAASAGYGAFSAGAVDVEAHEVPKWVLDRVGLKPVNARALSARGISMLPTIGDGDLLLLDVSKEKRIVVDGSIYVLSIDDGLFVKRLRHSPSGWILVSDNRSLYEEEPIPPGRQVTIHGQVVWVDRKLS